MNRRIRFLVAPLAMLVFASFAGVEPAQSSEWMWSITPYFWGSDLKLSVQVNDQQVIDQRVDLSQLIDKLDFVFSAHFEGRRDKFGFFGDVYFASFSGDERVFDLVDPEPGQVTATGDLEFSIFEAGGLYNPRGSGEGLSLLLGTRMFDVEQKIDANYDFDAGSTEIRNYKTSQTLWDVLVGARYIGRITERWFFNFKTDASAGGTDLTWTAMAGVGWTYGSKRQHAIMVGYRYMDIDFDEPSDAREDIDTEIEMAGFFGAFKFGF